MDCFNTILYTDIYNFFDIKILSNWTFCRIKFKSLITFVTMLGKTICEWKIQEERKRRFSTQMPIFLNPLQISVNKKMNFSEYLIQLLTFMTIYTRCHDSQFSCCSTYPATNLSSIRSKQFCKRWWRTIYLKLCKSCWKILIRSIERIQSANTSSRFR